MRAKRGAVDAQRNLRWVLAGFVFEAEALGYGEVHLIGGDGKFATGDAVADTPPTVLALTGEANNKETTARRYL